MSQQQDIRKQITEWVASDTTHAQIILHQVIFCLQQQIREANRVATEWETIAMQALETRLCKGHEASLASRIETLQSRSFYKWDRIVDKLRQRHATKNKGA